MEPRIVYLATYPPRRCGIATFTHDLRAAVGGEGRVFALDPADGSAPEHAGVEPPEVMAFLGGHTPADYRRAAIAVDGVGADVVSLQHEYGIYGGPDGEHVLAFVDRLQTPLVPTLHTILTHPSDRQRLILERLCGRAAAVVVMSRTAAELLMDGYDVNPSRVRVIPHGVPDLPRVEADDRKSQLGLGDRPTILSFGLIGPGKGYELVIEALGRVVEVVPDAGYVILGTTHPDLLRREGERYRDSLRERADRLGVLDRVRFEDRFVGRSELARWLQAADVFVTPYPNLDQIASGTLAYAMAAGLPVVSTPYLHAREMLAGDRGVLVEPGSPTAMAEALAALLGDPALRQFYATRAYAHGRRMIWPMVGTEYRALFATVAPARRQAEPAVRRLAPETLRVG